MALQKFFFIVILATSSFTHTMQNNDLERCRILVDLFCYQEQCVLAELVQAYSPAPVKFDIVSHEFVGQLLLVDVYDSPKNIVAKLGRRNWFNSKVLMHAPGAVK